MFHFDVVFGRKVSNLLVLSSKFSLMLEVSAKAVAFWKLERISGYFAFWGLKGISHGLFLDLIWKFGGLRLIAGNAELCCLPY